jgi:hypothetical protein
LPWRPASKAQKPRRDIVDFFFLIQRYSGCVKAVICLMGTHRVGPPQTARPMAERAGTASTAELAHTRIFGPHNWENEDEPS